MKSDRPIELRERMLPTTDCLLLGPGPSPVSPGVLAALGAAPRSHLHPEYVTLLDDLRDRLARVFRAPDDALTLAISGTGTAGMETVVANLLAAESDRLWNLNAVRVPARTNEGAGLGPLAGKIWRIGLMGSGATLTNVDRLIDVLPDALAAAG